MRESVRRAGQRFVVGFAGFEATADVKQLIREFGVGGVILFSRNVDTPEQVADLTRELQSVARQAGHDLPLLVSVDQEGGRVQRLRGAWTDWPAPRALGRSGSAELARRLGAALAAELQACGIHYDFAPVMDVDTNPRNPVIGDRALGDDPELVSRLGVAVIEGLQGGGVAACAKHFPGHGDTDLDSHLELPVVDLEPGRLREVELPPFRAATQAGVASIMTAHVLFPALDPERPATLSPSIVRGMLREELGYEGVIVADDLEMKAISQRWTPEASCVLAAAAGCDLFPVCRSHDAQVQAIEGLVRALESGELAATDADDAEQRVKRLKQRFVLPCAEADPKQARAAVGGAARRALAEEIAAAGSMV